MGILVSSVSDKSFPQIEVKAQRAASRTEGLSKGSWVAAEEPQKGYGLA